MAPKSSKRKRDDSPSKDVPPADAIPDADADQIHSALGAQRPASKRPRTRSATKEKDGHAEKAKNFGKRGKATKATNAKIPKAAKVLPQNITPTHHSVSTEKDPIECPAFPGEPPHHKRSLNHLTIPEMKLWATDNGIKPLKETSGKAKKEHWLAATAQEYEKLKRALIDHATAASIDLRDDPSSISPLEIRHRINEHYRVLPTGTEEGEKKDDAPAKKHHIVEGIIEPTASAAQKETADIMPKAGQGETVADLEEPLVRCLSRTELDSLLRKRALAPLENATHCDRMRLLLDDLVLEFNERCTGTHASITFATKHAEDSVLSDRNENFRQHIEHTKTVHGLAYAHNEVFDVINVDGDGNCLLRAFAEAWHGSEHFYEHTRVEIVDLWTQVFSEAPSASANCAVTRRREFYGQLMDDVVASGPHGDTRATLNRQVTENGVWGSDHLLQVLADTYGVQIFVHVNMWDHNNNAQWIVQGVGHPSYQEEVHLMHLGLGNHWYALRPTNDDLNYATLPGYIQQRLMQPWTFQVIGGTEPEQLPRIPAVAAAYRRPSSNDTQIEAPRMKEFRPTNYPRGPNWFRGREDAAPPPEPAVGFPMWPPQAEGGPNSRSSSRQPWAGDYGDAPGFTEPPLVDRHGNADQGTAGAADCQPAGVTTTEAQARKTPIVKQPSAASKKRKRGDSEEEEAEKGPTPGDVLARKRKKTSKVNSMRKLDRDSSPLSDVPSDPSAIRRTSPQSPSKTPFEPAGPEAPITEDPVGRAGNAGKSQNGPPDDIPSNRRGTSSRQSPLESPSFAPGEVRLKEGLNEKIDSQDDLGLDPTKSDDVDFAGDDLEASFTSQERAELDASGVNVQDGGDQDEKVRDEAFESEGNIENEAECSEYRTAGEDTLTQIAAAEAEFDNMDPEERQRILEEDTAYCKQEEEREEQRRRELGIPPLINPEGPPLDQDTPLTSVEPPEHFPDDSLDVLFNEPDDEDEDKENQPYLPSSRGDDNTHAPSRHTRDRNPSPEASPQASAPAPPLPAVPPISTTGITSAGMLIPSAGTSADLAAASHSTRTAAATSSNRVGSLFRPKEKRQKTPDMTPEEAIAQMIAAAAAKRAAADASTAQNQPLPTASSDSAVGDVDMGTRDPATLEDGRDLDRRTLDTTAAPGPLPPSKSTSASAAPPPPPPPPANNRSTTFPDSTLDDPPSVGQRLDSSTTPQPQPPPPPPPPTLNTNPASHPPPPASQPVPGSSSAITPNAADGSAGVRGGRKLPGAWKGRAAPEKRKRDESSDEEDEPEGKKGRFDGGGAGGGRDGDGAGRGGVSGIPGLGNL